METQAKQLLLLLQTKGYIQNAEGDFYSISFICTNQHFVTNYAGLQKTFGQQITIPKNTKAKYIKLAGILDGNTLTPIDEESCVELKSDAAIIKLLVDGYDHLDDFIKHS